MSENDEVSDEELLLELEKEEQLKLQNITNNINNTNININDTRNNINGTYTNGNNNNNNDGSGTLTKFQDRIITTGSEVSIVLLVLLVLLFIIQAIRKIHNHFKLQRALSNVNSAIKEAKGRSAVDFTPIAMDIDPKSYPVYNTEFLEQIEYDKKLKNNASKQELKNLLIKRAVNVIERFGTLQRDGTGIRKNWNLDLLPRDVWDDFQSAQKNINIEFRNIDMENKKFKFNWGKYGDDIFYCAREMLGNKVNNKKMLYHQNMKKLYKPPNANSFGNGFKKGFLNNNSNDTTNNNNDSSNNKLSRKQRIELKKQKKQQKKQERQDKQSLLLNEPRKRKPKPRFSNK